jgi:cysteinyl-tRNA synthetase
MLRSALEDDLDTPRALDVLSTFLAAANALCDAAMAKQGRVNASAVEAAEAGLDAIEALLGLGTTPPDALLVRIRDRRARARALDVGRVQQRIAQRAARRAERDFEAADQIQAELHALGVRLHDGPDGTSWSLV